MATGSVAKSSRDLFNPVSPVPFFFPLSSTGLVRVSLFSSRGLVEESERNDGILSRVSISGSRLILRLALLLSSTPAPPTLPARVRLIVPSSAAVIVVVLEPGLFGDNRATR